jgi:hypothetical protein
MRRDGSQSRLHRRETRRWWDHAVNACDDAIRGEVDRDPNVQVIADPYRVTHVYVPAFVARNSPAEAHSPVAREAQTGHAIEQHHQRTDCRLDRISVGALLKIVGL